MKLPQRAFLAAFGKCSVGDDLTAVVELIASRGRQQDERKKTVSPPYSSTCCGNAGGTALRAVRAIGTTQATLPAPIRMPNTFAQRNF